MESATSWAFEEDVLFGFWIVTDQNRLTIFGDTPGLGASALDVTWNILGGFGVYAGTRGTVKANARDHDLEIRIDMTCT
ncbi:MAG: hypothetical protein AAGF57_19695 [Pseudomonadota bacterium]